MAQGQQHKLKKPAKSKKHIQKVAARHTQVKKGNPLQLPKNNFRNDALDDRALSKAINKANEQKMAAKLIQAGGHVTTSDLMQKGKELSKEQRRSQVKKKVSRVEEKLIALRKAAEE